MGKKNKKNRPAADDWEDDVEDDILALAKELNGDAEENAVESPKKAKKGKSGGGFSMLSAMDALAIESGDDGDSASDSEPVQNRRPPPTSAEPAYDSEDDISEDETAIEPKVHIKTAAEKKAEKKEKERLKKEEEKKKKAAKKKKKQQSKAAEAEDNELDEIERALLEMGEEIPPKKEGEKPSAPEAKEPEPEEIVEEQDSKKEEDADGADGEVDQAEGNKKKKKKKKKKKDDDGEEAEKDSKKAAKPSAAVRKMQEALAARQLAEKLAREEEERRQKEFEEEQRRKEEEERIEEERREKKKQKEKERKARLKAEGKLLSKAEKERLAKQKRFVEELKAQGMEVPGSEPVSGQSSPSSVKKVVYGKNNKKKEMERLEAERKRKEKEEEERILKKAAEEAAAASAAAREKEGEEEEEEVDNWEDMLSDDDEGENEEDSEDNSESESEESSDEDLTREEIEERKKEAIADRIRQRKIDAENNKDLNELRSPICCVLGHVDTGKTKVLDKIRRTNVQTGEAGGITQQIGASYFPMYRILELTKGMAKAKELEFNVPGLLIIDTPGHESFSNLRNRGSSLCDIAILVIDIMHGLEPQTLESINLLKKRKTPFIVALNKIDRLYDWKSTADAPLSVCLKKQPKHTLDEFRKRADEVSVALAEQGLNAKLYYENKDFRKFVSLVPTSAHTGEGIPDLLMLMVQLTQKMMGERLAFTRNVECTVLEVKVIAGLGYTIDVILSNGELKEGDTIVVCGSDGPIVTQIRALLMPEPLKELRVKNQYKNHKVIKAAQGKLFIFSHVLMAVLTSQCMSFFPTST